MNKLFSFLAQLLIAACLLWSPLAQSGQTLRVGFYQLFGYHTISPAGAYSGYGYEYMQTVATHNGWNIQYVGYDRPWADMLTMLENGEIDLVTSAQKDPNRLKQFEFSKRPVCMSAAMLTIKGERTNFPIGDYSHYEGLHVGMIENNLNNVSFESFAKEHGFTYKISYFKTSGDRYRALQEGRVDAILSSNLRALKNETVIAIFNPVPLYAIVKKGNTALLKQYNNAVDDLFIHSSGFESKLWTKYYGNSTRGMEMTTADIKALEQIRASGKVLRVLVNPDRPPLSYLSDQKMQGGITQIARTTLDRLNLPYTFLLPKTREEYLRLLNNRSADICFDHPVDYPLAQRRGFQLVGQYLNVQLKEIRLQGNHSSKKVALIDGNRSNEFSLPTTNFQTVVSCRTTPDCIGKVISKEADFAYVNGYSADYLLQYFRGQNLQTFSIDSAFLPLAVGVSTQLNAAITHLLQKQVLSLRDRDIFPLIMESAAKSYHPTWSEFMHQYRLEVFLGIAAVLVLILLSWAITLYILRQKQALQKQKTELEFLTTHDLLTGLYNRNTFAQKVSTMLEAGSDEWYALVLFDIDRFQLINTFLGRKEADRLLCYVADLMRKHAVDQSKIVCGRISADVFACCVQFENSLMLYSNIEQFQKSLKDFNSDLDITAAFGICYIENTRTDVDRLIGNATLAAKSVKGNYLNAIAEYEPAMSSRIMRIQEITNQVRLALKQEQFEVFFQAKYDLSKQAYCGAEALVRWRHPDRGLIPPAEFIPIFEDNGFILKLDYYVWDKVCAYLRRKIDAHQPCLPVSVNVSRVTLNYSKIVDLITQLVDKYGLDHKLFELEITETTYMQTQTTVDQKVQALRRNGFTVLMDDFGSGYSSLGALKDIAVDVLKIDMRFLEKTEESLKRDNILSAVILMSQKLGLPLVIEGVENSVQVKFLRSLGCQVIQGFYFARPMPIKDYEVLISKGRADADT